MQAVKTSPFGELVKRASAPKLAVSRDGAHTRVARDPRPALEFAPDGQVRRAPPPLGGDRGLWLHDGPPGALDHGHRRGPAELGSGRTGRRRRPADLRG